MKTRILGFVALVSVAVIIAVAVNTEGRREVLGMEVGVSEAEPFWTNFLRSLARRGLRGVKLVISDAQEGLKAAIAKVFKATWQRCRVHFLRNALAYANKGLRHMVFALINTIFAQDTTEAAHAQWRVVVDQLLPIAREGVEGQAPTPASSVDYVYEPTAQEIFDELLPRYVESQVYRALLESNAAFFAAQMTAMDTATKNSAEMIGSLTLYMNKVRQAGITREIIEVVSGAQAL